MKVLLLAFFLAAASAIPVPDDDSGPVDVIVNGVPEGQPLEIGDIVDIKVKEVNADGEVVSATNVLHPFTAQGLAEAAAAAQPPVAVELPEVIDIDIPEPIDLPEPGVPEVVLPEPGVPEVVLPEPGLPDPIVIPEPVVPEVVEEIPDVVVLPEPPAPEVIEDPITDVDVVDSEPVPAPAPQLPNGEIFNDGIVSVTVNRPEDTGVVATLQSWFNMVMNYINTNGATTTHQII